MLKRRRDWLKWIGVALAVLSILAPTLGIALGASNPNQLLAIAAIGSLTGLFLVVSDRATEISFGRVGTIKAAAEQATQDAQLISDLRKKVEQQQISVEATRATAITAAELTRATAETLANTRDRLRLIDETTNRALGETERLERLADFLRLTVEAYNDSRAAYDELRRWAADKNNPLAVQADDVCTKVLFAHSKPFYFKDFDHSWIVRELSAPIYAGMPLFEALRKKYGMTTAQFRPAILEFMWRHEEITEDQKIEFIRDVLRNDDSLQAVEYAGTLGAELLDLPIKPLMVEPLLDSLHARRTRGKTGADNATRES